MSRSHPLPYLAEMAAALEATEQPMTSFAALDSALAGAIGHKLFTILLHEPEAGFNTRIYSNEPVTYPLGGRKRITDSAWMKLIIHEGRHWIGRDAADIEWAFFDHALIASLGCASALNMPVRWRGRTIGTLNLLHEAGYYDEADAEVARVFAGLAVPALLLAQPPG